MLTKFITNKMKSKTINKILTGKFIAWTKSIEDEGTRKLVEENSIITGGSIVSLLQNEEVSDFDVYFRNTETAFAVAKYYVKKLLENPPPAFKDNPHRKVEIEARIDKFPLPSPDIDGKCPPPIPDRVRIVVKSAGIASGTTVAQDYQYFEGIRNEDAQAVATEAYVEGQITDHSEPTEQDEVEAYTKNVSELDDHSADAIENLPDTKAAKGAKTKYHVRFVTSNAITLSDQMQLILRFQGEPEIIHTNYDFVHCTSYWTSWERKLTLRPEALECILTKELRYIGSKYPICSIIRTRKFIMRGWTINAGQYVKMCYQISKLDMNDVNVLADQLVGVDSAYFNQLIEELRKSPADQKVDGQYLMTLIDKIF